MDLTFIRTILRGVQILFTLLLTALIGNVIASNVKAASSAEAAVNFSMFVVVISWLAALYGLASNFASTLARPIIQMPLDGLATLFTTIDAIVLAAMLKAVNCADLSHKTHPSNYIAFGSPDDTKRCRELQASTAFMWFLVVSYAATFFFSFRDFQQGGLGGGSIRSTRPSMAQVGV